MNDEQMIFDEANHTYTKGGNAYISVTTLLEKYNLSADYSNIPKNVLDNAAKEGTYKHKCLEEYIKHRTILDPAVVDPFMVYTHNRGIDLDLAKSEEMIYNDKYRIAGTVDFQYEDNGIDVIADFKNTSSIHYDSVTWQLSIYNFIIANGNIFEYARKAIKVIHIKNGFSVTQLPLIPYDEVEKLLAANLTNSPYTYTPDYSQVVQTTDAVIYRAVLEELKEYEQAVEELKSKKKQYEDKIIKNMQVNNFKKIKINGININVITKKARETWDDAKLKQYFTAQCIDSSKFKKITGKDITYIQSTIIDAATINRDEE